jgi:hypothetical protein
MCGEALYRLLELSIQSPRKEVAWLLGMTHCSASAPSALCQLDKLLLIYLLTYLLTPWSRVFPGKITGSQQVKKFPALYGTQRFITEFTSARHSSLS